MQKILEGVVVSVGMENSVVVRLTRRDPHPIYKKIIKRHRRVKADTVGLSVAVGDRVRIRETKPISKSKHFKILEVAKDGAA